MQVNAIIKDNIVECVTVDGMMTQKLDQSGHCRQVFQLNDSHYIKFDNPPLEESWGKDCAFQTSAELCLVEVIEEEDQKYFCLPVAKGKIKGIHYLVQRAVMQEANPTLEDIEELQQILDKYSLSDVGFCEEWGNHNCCFTNEGWKIFDYALVK